MTPLVVAVVIVVVVVVLVEVVLNVSNFEASAEHKSHANGGVHQLKISNLPLLNCRNPIDVKFHLHQGYGVQYHYQLSHWKSVNP